MRQTVVRHSVTWFALVGLLLVISGCGGQPSAPVTKLPPNTPGGAPSGNAGGPPPPENRPVAAMGGGAAPAAGAPAAQPAAPSVTESLGATDIFGNPLAPRERPVAAMGGGGAPAAGGSASSGSSANNNRPGNNSGSTSPIGLVNGLYPQGMTGSGGSTGGGGTIAGGLQNGLYPQFTSTGSPSNLAAGSATAGNSLPAAASALAGDNASGSTAATAGAAAEFFETAKQLFKEGDDTAAARNLYAFLLAKEDAFEEYPLQWFPGLKQPRAFLRIGVGVTYSRPRDFDGKPPVIGDPVASDRAGGGGRRGNAPPDNGDGILGASGANPGGAGGGSNSPYANVDTSTPAGFLLYYTGDYVEKLYQELNSRRKGSETKFGKLLAQFPERTPTAPAASQNENVSSQPFPPQGGPPANRPTIALGGGPGGGGAPPAGGGGGAGAGGGGGEANNANANRNARNARKLVDLWSGSDASTPERLTTGTLTPGVIVLGEGKKEELFSRAKKFGVDVILLFDVKVGEARGENYSTTTLRLFNVDNPEEQLALGRQLRSNVVMEARDDGKADPVAAELTRVVEEYMDQNLAAQELPKSLTQENVTKRIETVLAGETDDALKTAVEVVGFYRVGLLPEDKVVEALNKLLGEDLAEAILNGKETDRVAQLKKLVEDD